MASRRNRRCYGRVKPVSGPAKLDPCMRLGIRTAISALVLTSIVVSAVGVHLLWWRTAHQVSQTLANTINDQIVSAVGDELQSVTTEARSSHDGGANAAGRKSVRAARRQEARSRVPVAIAVAADHFLGGVRMAGWIVLCRAQGRRWRHRNAGDHARTASCGPTATNSSATIFSSRTARSRTPNIPSPIRNGFATAIETNDELLVDLDDASQRRAAGGGLRCADRYRRQARRRHRHHHRTDAGVEFPVAAHGRKIGRRLHPRTQRQGGRRARSERQRGWWR